LNLNSTFFRIIGFIFFTSLIFTEDKVEKEYFKDGSEKIGNNSSLEKYMISIGFADDVPDVRASKSFKLALFTEKSGTAYKGFSISGRDYLKKTNWNTYHQIQYLIGFSYLKFRDVSERGFYYGIDTGIAYSTLSSEDFSLFGIGIGLLAPYLDFNGEAVHGDVTRSGYGVGSNFTLGYSFDKIMLGASLSSYNYSNQDFNLDEFDNFRSLHISYLF